MAIVHARPVRRRQLFPAAELLLQRRFERVQRLREPAAPTAAPAAAGIASAAPTPAATVPAGDDPATAARASARSVAAAYASTPTPTSTSAWPVARTRACSARGC